MSFFKYLNYDKNLLRKNLLFFSLSFKFLSFEKFDLNLKFLLLKNKKNKKDVQYATTGVTLSAEPSLDFEIKATSFGLDHFYLQAGLDLGFDSWFKLNISKSTTYQFPEKTLVDNYVIMNFAIPIILGIAIPGRVTASLKANLGLGMDLEKPIDVDLYYSKHVKFSLPFKFADGKMNYPNWKNFYTVYGEQRFNFDATQFKQIPKFNGLLTFTPILAVTWPYLGLSTYPTSTRIPEWLLDHHQIHKRNVVDDIKRFIQMTLANQVPLIVTMGITACTKKCSSPKPIETSVQANLGDYQATFTGLNISKQFTIPISVAITPEYSFCLPVKLNFCKSVTSINIKKLLLI